MKPLSECWLYAFVDTSYSRGRAPAAMAQELCDGGADLLQLRAKQSAPEDIRRMAEAILPITRKAGIGLVINDHLAVARAVGAEYCHLGQEDFFEAGYSQVRQLAAHGSESGMGGTGQVGRTAVSAADSGLLDRGRNTAGQTGMSALQPGELRIGLSSHSPAEAQRALAAGAAYLGVGPVYATGTKPEAKPVTLEYVRWAAANVKIPWFAIGGVQLSNLDEVLAAGARRICVVSAILNAPNVAAACQAFRERLGS